MDEILKFKKANCKNCFKCLRECPVKAIGFKDGQAEILRSDCLICGHCLTVCPQNAKVVRDDTGIVKEAVKSGRRVIASVAPSFAAAFTTDFKAFSDALKKFGFYTAEETSAGAVPVTRKYEQLIASRKMPCVISSACPTIVKLIEKYHTGAMRYLAPVISPMTAHARMLKKRYKDCYVVFIGPCMSKKDEELWEKDAVDCVITFEELEQWFKSENVTFNDSDLPGSADFDGNNARLYPTAGGIVSAMRSRIPGVNYITAEGIEKCRKILSELENNELEGLFIEMSACSGSCMNGPCMSKPESGLLKAQKRIETFAKSRDISKPDLKENVDYNENLEEKFGIALERRFTIKPVISPMPGERDIRAILEKTNKFTPDQELNCGACGYATCREKAIAVFQGKAEVTMCMPYMRERAEYISDKVISFSPNAIIVLDSLLSIQAMNSSACKLFGIDDIKKFSGRYIGELTDASAFEEAVVRRENILNRKIYLFRYDKYVEQSVIYVKEHNIIFAILHDLTEEKKQNDSLKKVKMETVRTADNVIERQMRVVQEIAMLLGETTAETKVALTKLKDTMISGEE